MNESITSFHGDSYEFLSNYYEVSVRYDGLTYGSTEAAFQAQKCKTYDERIAFTSYRPDQSKKAGRNVELRDDWNDVKIRIMEEIVRAKFTQHPELAERLLATGDALLVEGNGWGDRFWGVDRRSGEGENHLGLILMKVRGELRDDDMSVLVPQRLGEVELSHNVTVLHAAESGSRAWGFASPDSDYDVRFIYKRPMSEYLRLEETRDVIELPVNDTWDVSGWDLAKTLRLLWKSNPTLYEWLNSPIRYCDTGFAERIRPLTLEYFSRRNMIHHYLSMAQHNIRDYMNGETVRPKKYLYMLRPILACFWIQNHDSTPPVRFSELADQTLPKELKPSLDDLLALKASTSETEETAHIADIESFLNAGTETMTQYLEHCPKEEPKSWDSLNEFFISEIGNTPSSSLS